jgi:hypothetical protein
MKITEESIESISSYEAVAVINFIDEHVKCELAEIMLSGTACQ